MALRAGPPLIRRHPAVSHDPLVVVTHVEEPGGRVHHALGEPAPEGPVGAGQVAGLAGRRGPRLDRDPGGPVALEALPHRREMTPVRPLGAPHPPVAGEAAHAVLDVRAVREPQARGREARGRDQDLVELPEPLVAEAAARLRGRPRPIDPLLVAREAALLARDERVTRPLAHPRAEVTSHAAQRAMSGVRVVHPERDPLGRVDDRRRERGITAHVLQTEEAVERYNELVEEARAVGALIHSTC